MVGLDMALVSLLVTVNLQDANLASITFQLGRIDTDYAWFLLHRLTTYRSGSWGAF
jgi:hypothetical protein